MSIKQHSNDNEGTLHFVAENAPSPVISQHHKQWYALFISPLSFCFLIALVVRIWLVVHTHAVFDGDEALVGIQAERILRGEFPIYFYGQPYMGSLEVYFIAIIFALLGPSAWTLRIEPILLSLVVVWLTWELAAALADVAQLPLYARRLFMTSAALLAAVPPLYDAIIEVRTYGGYIETFVLMLLLLFSAVHLTRRWFAGASWTELAWRWAGIGFLVGLGFWIYPMIAVAILASAIWIIGSLLLEIIKLCRIKPAGTERTLSTNLHPAKDLWLAVAAGPAAIVGFTPGIIWGATHNWTNIAYIVGLGGRDSISHHLRTINHVTQAYISCVAPRIISGSLPTAGGILTTLHWPLLYIGTFFIFATVALIAVSFLWQQPLLMQFRRLAALPTIFAGCCALAFCTSSVAVFTLLGCQLDDTGRYATPLSLSLPFFFAATCTFVYMIANERGKRTQHANQQDNQATTSSVSRRFRPVVAVQGVVFVLVIIYLGTQTWSYVQTDPGLTFQSNYCTIAPANNDPIVAYLQREHIHYFWASNLLGYPLVFKANNSIIGADPLPLINPSIAINRIPAYTNAILHADRPSMLVVIKHNDPHPTLLRLFDERHVTYRMAIFPSEPGFDILVVSPLSRSVSPLESKDFDIFYCFLK